MKNYCPTFKGLVERYKIKAHSAKAKYFSFHRNVRFFAIVLCVSDEPRILQSFFLTLCLATKSS